MKLPEGSNPGPTEPPSANKGSNCFSSSSSPHTSKNDMDGLSLLEVQQWMRFDPPEDKVINVLLRAKITGKDESVRFIPEAQICKWEPLDLKDSCWIKTAYPEWWFFAPLDLKCRSGNRLNRATKDGFWKVTGKDKIIESHLERIGKKKYLVFYSGRGKGTKTNWTIHEYHTTLKDLDGTHPGQNAFVLCRLSYENEKSIKDTNINDAGLAVSSPTKSKLFHEESKPSDPVTYNLTVVSNKDNGSCTGSGAKMANKPLELCDQNSYNAYTAKNEVLEATASELVESLYMRDLPKPPDCNLHMPFGRPSPVTNDSNNSHCRMDFQFVTYGLDPYDNEFRDLTTDYLNEIFPNTSGS